jgi:succinyl-CoA synthetase alpha subunit
VITVVIGICGDPNLQNQPALVLNLLMNDPETERIVMVKLVVNLPEADAAHYQSYKTASQL